MIDVLLKKIECNKPDFNKLESMVASNSISITFCNPLAIKVYEQNRDYRKEIVNIDLIYSDGMLLCKFLEILNKKPYKRVSFDGNSAAPLFFNHAVSNNLKTCFIGGKPGISKKASKIISNIFNIKIPLSYHGYFNESEYDKIIDEMKENDIRFVLIGMGVPKQEFLANRIKNKLDNAIVITCGGYLDQIVNSNNLKYYPKLFSRFNLRFLYRVIKEPKKMISRYLYDYIPFYKIYMKNIFKNR